MRFRLTLGLLAVAWMVHVPADAAPIEGLYDWMFSATKGRVPTSEEELVTGGGTFFLNADGTVSDFVAILEGTELITASETTLAGEGAGVLNGTVLTGDVVSACVVPDMFGGCLVFEEFQLRLIFGSDGGFGGFVSDGPFTVHGLEGTYSSSLSTVPEPSTLLLCLAGFGAFAQRSQRRPRNEAESDFVVHRREKLGGRRTRNSG